MQNTQILGKEHPPVEVASSTSSLVPLKGASPVATSSADSAATASFAVPDPLQVSVGESDAEDLGTLDESQFYCCGRRQNTSC